MEEIRPAHLLNYARPEGGREYRNGDFIDARAIAEQAGMGIVQLAPNMAHWVNPPNTLHVVKTPPTEERWPR